MPQTDTTANLSEVVMPPADAEIVWGYAREEMWDSESDTGMKPTQSGGYASDESMEVDDMLLEGADVGIQGAMADLIVELEDGDPRDFEWLPLKQRKKIVPKRTGMISFTD